jgi:hypothetical protein
MPRMQVKNRVSARQTPDCRNHGWDYFNHGSHGWPRMEEEKKVFF